MEKETKLATMGITSEEFGKALVENAQNEEKKKKILSVSAQVQTMLQQIEVIEKSQKINTVNLGIYKARIKAIQAGEFSVHGYNHLEIRFNDESLNRLLTLEDA